MTKRHTKTAKKKPAPKLPFTGKAKKGHATMHVLVGISQTGSMIVHHPSPDETRGDAISELISSFEFGEHVDIHHFTTVLPYAKAPRPKKARTKKIFESVVRETFDPKPDAGAA